MLTSWSNSNWRAVRESEGPLPIALSVFYLSNKAEWN